MSIFVILCHDGPDALRLRADHLAAHLAHVEAHIARYAAAGPLARDGETVGSLLAVHAETEADARAFLATDPYAQAGVWATLELWAWKPAAGDWVGGVSWKR